MGIKEQVLKVKEGLIKKFPKRKIKAIINRKVKALVNNRGLGKVRSKAFAFAYSKSIEALGLMPVSKENVYKVLTGKAEDLTETELISVGMVIKNFNKPNLDVILFVKECKDGVYRE